MHDGIGHMVLWQGDPPPPGKETPLAGEPPWLGDPPEWETPWQGDRLAGRPLARRPPGKETPSTTKKH